MKPYMTANIRQEGNALYLRVLGYLRQDGSWAAHCLETDLVGYGKSFQAALDNLQELTEMQISFAIYKNQPALLDCPAPPDIIEMYNYLVRSSIQWFTRPEKKDRKRRITSIPWPNNLTESDFALAQM
jgi:hypothetical protein